MRDYWMTQSLLQVMGWGYVAVVLIALLIAAWAPRRNPHKALWVLIVLGVGSILPIKSYQQYEEQNQMAEARKQQYAKAKALFDARCKGSGERIYQTVNGVEGFLWQKWRPEDINYGDQFRLSDPYGRDCGGEACIKNMLRVTTGENLNPEDAKERANGYGFIESIDPADGMKYRYAGVITSVHKRSAEQIEQYRKNTGSEPALDVYGFAIKKDPVKEFSARYGVTWVDISTPEDREYWVAGGVIRITDLQTQKIIAERFGYLMDPGQGSTSGQRSPWAWARSSVSTCPSVDGHNFKFIRAVLNPKH
ncbi:hypothetical protein AVKW3434_23710 [Acidovorax sp. SUPP3434]|uniref:hypothetical protein n=1 Tax=Acidovorax sp. SUPP3434 TaxID=2920880 RepID=UPI0023DE6648|nr:hypothetical protein [Acidovorax sp. SUPP3434]GKT02453.1 hypothetical protein AVKW3434_23710 [Acidovorax sp. SUPP3434]